MAVIGGRGGAPAPAAFVAVPFTSTLDETGRVQPLGRRLVALLISCVEDTLYDIFNTHRRNCTVLLRERRANYISPGLGFGAVAPVWKLWWRTPSACVEKLPKVRAHGELRAVKPAASG